MNTILDTKEYQVQLDEEGTYITLQDHPASIECFKLQIYLNWEFELN